MNLIFFKKIVKTYGYIFQERFHPDTMFKISFSLPLSEVIKYKDMAITVDGLSYQEVRAYAPPIKNNLVNVDRIIYAGAYDNHFILEEPLPFDFTTEKYRISKMVKRF